jgi:hypothetical protein
MAKIHRYLIFNSKNELSYFKNNYSDNEIMDLVTNAYSLLENDFEEEENLKNIDEVLEKENISDYNNSRYILSIEEIIDLHNEMLIREPFIIVENERFDEKNNESDEEGLEDYNSADLVENIINLDY